MTTQPDHLPRRFSESEVCHIGILATLASGTIRNTCSTCNPHVAQAAQWALDKILHKTQTQTHEQQPTTPPLR
jgi:hypothetical protein